jgi:hypothetical protein
MMMIEIRYLPSHIQTKIQALYDSRLQIQFDHYLNNVGSTVQGSQSTIRSHLDEDRNAHVLCLRGNKNDIVQLPQGKKYVEEFQDNTSGTDESHSSGTHGCTEDISGTVWRRRLSPSIVSREC